MLNRTLLASLWTLAMTPALAAMTMTVNTKDGDTISGKHQFVVRVQSEHLVTNVEFYVGDDLRDTDESTPYQFGLDTIEEKQGPLMVTFAAFDSEGNSVKQKLSLKIDNGFEKGVDFHVNRSNELLKESKFADAVEACRVALKIDPKSNKARLAMARANFAVGTMDVAQKFAEDVVASDADNVEAKSLLTAINLRKAFKASGEDSVMLISGALQTAAKNQFDILNLRADAISLSDSNLVAYVDAQLQAHRYARAIQALKPKFDADQKNSDIADRLAYALLRSARYSELQAVIALNKRFGEPSGYMFAIEALSLQAQNSTSASEDSEKEALLSDPSSMAVKYTQAALALGRNKLDVLSNIVNDLDRSAPNEPMTNYYRAIRAYYTRDWDGSKLAFQNCVLADPANYDMFIEKGNQSLEVVYSLGLTGTEAKNRREIAVAYFNAALNARPESFEALTGLSVAHNLLGDTDKAVSFGRGAVAAAPEYGAAGYALAAAFRSARDTQNAGSALAAAAKVDKGLVGLPLPKPEDAYIYFYRHGRIPLIPAPGR